MDDPYEKARKIHKGEMDDEMPTYSELCQWIERIPATWLPGLLRRLVMICVRRDVFKEGGLEATVAYGKKVGSDPHPYLRSEDTNDQQPLMPRRPPPEGE